MARGGSARGGSARGVARCGWVADDPLLVRYHDREWGRPVRGDRAFFEKMSLEVFQPGLSWRLIVHKRPGFRRAFHRFDPAKVARFGEREIARLMKDEGIVRHRLKIEATIHNARRFLELARTNGGFARYLDTLGEEPGAIMVALRRDFRFMGPSVAASFLQEVGRIPLAHDPRCFLHVPRRAGRGGE